MVRAAFYCCIGLFLVPFHNAGVLANDGEPQMISRLRLQTSTKLLLCQAPSRLRWEAASSANHNSQCAKFFSSVTAGRLNFSQKKEGFSLRNVREISSLSQQGGSRIFHAANTIPLIADVLSAGIEMVYRDPFLSVKTTPSPTTQLGTQLVLKGSMNRMTYRAEYGYTDQDTSSALSLAPHDRVGGKLLWEWQLPFVTPKFEFSRFASNVDRDPSRPQMISTRQHYSLDWTIPEWPSFTLSYSREQKDLLNLSEGSRTDATAIERVTAKAAFEHPLGKAEWLSRYSTFQQNIHAQRKMEELHITVKGTLPLFHPLKFSPQIGYTQNNNVRQGLSHDRLWANLGMAVRLSPEHTLQSNFQWTRIGQRDHTSRSKIISTNMHYSYDPAAHGYHVVFIGQYALAQYVQQTTNSQSYDLSLFIQKDIHDLLHFPHRQQSLSLKFTHNQHIHALLSPTSRSYSSAMLLFNIIP